MKHTLDRNISPRAPITDDIDRIIPIEGQPFRVQHLAPNLGNEAFKLFLFQPDDPITDEPTTFAFGVGANRVHYLQEAEAMAALKLPVAIQKDPRKLKRLDIRKLITSPRARKAALKHAKNRAIHSSEIAGSVMDAVQDFSSQYKKFKVKGHSKGGLPAGMIAARDDRISTVTFDGSAGFTLGNALLGHGQQAIPIARNVGAFMGYLAENGPEDTMSESLDNIKEGAILLGGEVVMLVAKTPTVVPLLEEIDASDRNVAVIAASHEFDAFFPQRKMDHAIGILQDRGLVHHYERSLGTEHTNPMDNPLGSAALYLSMINSVQASNQLNKLVSF